MAGAAEPIAARRLDFTADCGHLVPGLALDRQRWKNTQERGIAPVITTNQEAISPELMVTQS